MKKRMKSLKVKEHLMQLIPRLLIIIIVGQTLPFKFLGSEESVWIFSQLNMEPYGRIFTGILELTAILFLLTRFYRIGAYMTLGIVGGALIFHLTILGVEIQNDGGLLFILSIIVTLSSLWLITYQRIFKTDSQLDIQFKKPHRNLDTVELR